jgi:hypothetical protein
VKLVFQELVYDIMVISQSGETEWVGRFIRCSWYCGPKKEQLSMSVNRFIERAHESLFVRFRCCALRRCLLIGGKGKRRRQKRGSGARKQRTKEKRRMTMTQQK